MTKHNIKRHIEGYQDVWEKKLSECPEEEKKFWEGHVKAAEFLLLSLEVNPTLNVSIDEIRRGSE